MKYVDTAVTFAEIPDEITLCINISNCPIGCKGCHSSYLSKDIGTPITPEVIDNLIDSNKGISCVCLMGGDSCHEEVNDILHYIRDSYPYLKTAWYSGCDEISEYVNMKYLDFIKIGHYDPDKGPLTSKTTNQRLYGVFADIDLTLFGIVLRDLTYKFWEK